MRGIIWFRRDLRVYDHPALTTACKECDDVLPLFVFDDLLLQSHEFGPACVNFMLGCLNDLQASLAKLGLVLRWRRGVQVDEVVRTAVEWNADVVYWGRDYEPHAIARDRVVQEQLAHNRITAKTFKDHVVFETDEVCGVTGKPIQRYSVYRARWWVRWHVATPTLRSTPQPLTTSTRAGRFPAPPLPTADDLGYGHVIPWIEPGERSARTQLRRFLKGPIHRYADGRNRPAIDCSSKLSPHFRFGTLSPRVAVHAALESLSQRNSVSRPDVLIWIDQLIWREFFQQILATFPHAVDRPFRNSVVPLPRAPGPERDRLFQSWCEGNTGYPIVDAGMRQLNQTGWMHNRVRMVVASFLIKALRIDWQSGERYFLCHLLDADVAANNGNWQWCASTGTDAMRGYRIFNPILQSKKFDPEGVYIRRYVPQLARVPAAKIHEPHRLSPDDQHRYGCHIGVDYPAPVVDHRQAREEYLALGKQQVTT